MKRLFISLLLLLTPLALIRGEAEEAQKLYDRLSHEAESHEELRKVLLESKYIVYRAILDLKTVLDDTFKGCNVVGYPFRNEYLEKKIAPEVVRDIDYDPNNEAIILYILCRDSEETGEETGNDSDEVKNEKVSTCVENLGNFISECRKRMKKTKEVNQEK